MNKSHDHGMDILGVEAGGFDISSIFSAAGEIVTKGVKYKQDKDAGEAAAKDSAAKVKAIIAADDDATWATARALYDSLEAADPKNAARKADLDAKTFADTAAAQVAVQAQTAAAAGLSPGDATKRLSAAQARAAKAVSDLQASPSDRYRQCVARAAQATATMAAHGQIVSSSPQGYGDPSAAMTRASDYAAEEVGFFSRKVGPVPYWGIGAALAGVGGLLLWRRR